LSSPNFSHVEIRLKFSLDHANFFNYIHNNKKKTQILRKEIKMSMVKLSWACLPTFHHFSRLPFQCVWKRTGDKPFNLWLNRSDWSIQLMSFFGLSFKHLFCEFWLAYFATVMNMYCKFKSDFITILSFLVLGIQTR